MSGQNSPRKKQKIASKYFSQDAPIVSATPDSTLDDKQNDFAIDNNEHSRKNLINTRQLKFTEWTQDDFENSKQGPDKASSFDDHDENDYNIVLKASKNNNSLEKQENPYIINQKRSLVSTSDGSSSVSNPFAKFAFVDSNISSKPSRLSQHVHVQLKPKQQQDLKSDKIEEEQVKKKEWVKLSELPLEDQERVIEKWHSIVNVDVTTPIEDVRFAIFVAARLHARCQEPVVKQAIQKLQSNVKLTVDDVAQIDDPIEEIVPYITSLQYHNTKAKQLVQAAREIKELFNGRLPETENELQQLTGIGPVLSDLLSVVNKRAVHMKRRQMLKDETDV